MAALVAVEDIVKMLRKDNEFVVRGISPRDVNPRGVASNVNL